MRERSASYIEVTADVDNLASRRVIEANGGVLVERFQKLIALGGEEGLRFGIALDEHPSGIPRDGPMTLGRFAGLALRAISGTMDSRLRSAEEESIRLSSSWSSCRRVLRASIPFIARVTPRVLSGWQELGLLDSRPRSDE